MRGLVVIIGIGIAVGGLGVAGHQAIDWYKYGYWPPQQFAYLWFELGGSEPATWGIPPAQAMMEWLLDQPLSMVLLISGLIIAWLGVDRRHRPWTRL